ncbi:MAG: type II secretion system F family protein [Steroidobacteraceae bacterium]|jgi:tight adherence protein B|nr:type II secretion system F family protein [Steroidobacteraceae bacterium]
MTSAVAIAASVAALAAAAAGALLAWRAGAWGSLRHRRRLEHLTRVELVELFVFVEPARFLRWNLVALACLPALGWLLSGSQWVAAASFVAVLVLPALVHRRLRRRRLQLLQRQLPDAVAAVAAGLRGGAALWQALELVPRHQPRPVAQEFALLLRQHRLGVPMEEVLEGFAQRTALHDARMLAATLAVARDLGGGLAEALERLASSVRRRVAMEERIDALTAQGRMQGTIVGALPLVVAMVLYAMEPESMGRLASTPLGWSVVGLVLVLEVVGALLIRKIVRIDV